MAKHSALLRSPSVIVLTATLLFVFFFVTAYLPTAVTGFGGMVGGKTEVKDVKTNKEVQELGRFSVEEFNRSHRRHRREEKGNGGVSGDLTFSEVVEAEKQVVSGIKYYMKVAATENGVPRTFDAVVVVKPWVKSKELLNFAPSPSTK